MRNRLYGMCTPLLLALTTMLLAVTVSQAQPVIIRMETDQVYDSVYTPRPVSLIMTVNPNGVNMSSFGIVMRFEFTNGNIIGPIQESSEFTGSPAFIFSDHSRTVFEQNHADAIMLDNFADEPVDTLLVGVLDFTGDGTWFGPREIFRITFLPLDTGSFTIRPVRVSPGGPLDVLDQHGVAVPYDWVDPTIHIPLQRGPVDFRIRSLYTDDTLYVGAKTMLFFDADATGFVISDLLLNSVFTFGGGRVFPGTAYSDGWAYSATASLVFGALTFRAVSSDPDTVQSSLSGGNVTGWSSSGSFASFEFVATDPGTISIDTTNAVAAPSVGARALDQSGAELPITWQPRSFVVVPCPVMMGDANNDAALNSSDIIYLVNTVFKGGPMPLPRAESGDAACKGRLDAASVLYLVNHIFRGGDPPCACFPKTIR